MRVNPSHLRGDVGAHSEGFAGFSVSELTGELIKIRTQSHKKRIGKLHQRGNHVLVPPSGADIEEPSTAMLNTARLFRQKLIDPIWEQPSCCVTHVLVPSYKSRGSARKKKAEPAYYHRYGLRYTVEDYFPALGSLKYWKN
jgi:hypothetical protein